jgi:hypothetical protein
MDEEDWKLFDNLTWSTLEKVIEKMPSSSSSSAEVRRRLLLLPVARIIRDAYGMTFRLTRMQFDPSVEESDLNDLRRLVCRKVEELFINASSDDHQMMAAADDDPPGRRRREEQPAAAAAAAAAPPPPPPPTMP